MDRSKLRAAALAMGFTALVAPAPVVADEAHTLAVQLEWITSGYQSPFYLAAAKGWYKEAGLEVSITPGTGSVTTVQLIGGGQADVGHASLSNVAFGRAKGMPVVAIANFFRTGDICLLVPDDSPINTVGDLKGKRLIATAGSFEGPFIDSFLSTGGLTRSDVTLQNIDFNTRSAIYARGDSDGLFGSPVGTGVLLNKLRPSRCLLFADYGLNLPGFGIFATQAKLKQKGAALRLFTSIVAGAWTYAVASPAHEAEAVDALVGARATDRVDRADMLKQLQVSVPFLQSSHSKGLPIGVQTDADWADAIAAMEKAKAIDPGTKPADYFTNDYLDLALVKKIGAR
jgi:NitT/TauT family transport system substrate-binding protein